MERNQWNAASEQLLKHWARSGITQIPRTSPQSVAAAEAWLKAYAATIFTASGSIEKAPTQTSPASFPTVVKENMAVVHERKMAELDAKAESLPAAVQIGPAAAQSGTVTIPATPVVSKVGPKKAAAPVPSLGQPAGWNSNSLASSDRLDVMTSLNADVDACRKCEEIVCRRQRTVFGVGSLNARVVMFGEAPGADEDRVGEPFVGAAGQLLDKILAASGLKRPEVYILNALKCRPPGNRTPTDNEIENCRPFFESQLEAIQPEYIVCWGAVAVRAVLKSTESVGRLRGKFHSFRGAKVMVTYHPAYLLRNPDAKRLTWDDMKMLMKEMGIPIPGKAS